MGVTTSNSVVGTYQAIATYLVSGTSTTTYSFNSIPSTYTDLILVFNGLTSTNTDICLRFNSDSGNNYTSTYMYGTSSTNGSSRRTTTTALARLLIEEAGTGTGWMNIHVSIQNYADTSINKTVLSNSASASNGATVIAGKWASTAAINSITINCDSGYMVAGTNFTIYGIKAA